MLYDSATAEIKELALRTAEAQMELRRIRQARNNLFNQHLRDPYNESRKTRIDGDLHKCKLRRTALPGCTLWLRRVSSQGKTQGAHHTHYRVALGIACLAERLI